MRTRFLTTAAALWSIGTSIGNGQIVMPPGSYVEGKSIAEYTVEWWRWGGSMPSAVSPQLDLTGARANNNQSGPVFFLGGARSYMLPQFLPPIVRWFDIPAGRHVLLAVRAGFVVSRPEDEARQIVTDAVNAVDFLDATIDGAEIPNLFSHREPTPTFQWSVVANNAFGLPAGIYDPMVADGYWVMLEPLSPGWHTITTQGATTSQGMYGTHVTRHIYSIPTVDVLSGDVSFIARGSSWNYLDNGSDPGAAWMLMDDGSWTQGASPLGYGDGDETTSVDFGPDPQNKHATTYFRRAFTVEPNDLALLESVKGLLVRDDGAAVYLNGVEIYRDANLAPGAPFDEFASYLDAPPLDAPWFNESAPVLLDIDPALLVPGPNLLAVEVHQQNGQDSDLSFDLELVGVFSSVPGDVDGDGRVDRLDVALMASYIGVSQGAGRTSGDLTGDGRVDLFDAMQLQTQLGMPIPSAPIPEPDTLVILVASLLAVVWRSRRARYACRQRVRYAGNWRGKLM